jgi:hypothetical protein
MRAWRRTPPRASTAPTTTATTAIRRRASAIGRRSASSRASSPRGPTTSRCPCARSSTSAAAWGIGARRRARRGRARWHGVDVSEHLCDELGWTRGSIVDLDPAAALGRATFDLVICSDVLQYLGDRDATVAMRNLARWSDGALYFEALTKLDWERHCERAHTDGDVHLRTGAWYRRRLARGFQACGGGVFVSRRAGCTLFELEGL